MRVGWLSGSEMNKDRPFFPLDFKLKKDYEFSCVYSRIYLQVKNSMNMVHFQNV